MKPKTEKSFALFSGSSHEELAQEVAESLHISLGKAAIETFPDGEIGIQILENVRGKDVFVLQSVARHPNHYLVELLIFVDALKRASARSISVVMPYYPYARQDRRDKGRSPITAKLVADLLERAGVDRLLTMDLHTEQIEGFFDIPVDNLYARPLFVEALKKRDLKEAVIVSPDVGGNRMARKFAEDLGLGIAVVDKRRVTARKVEPFALIGDVGGKRVIIVDDIYSTGSTLKTAARVCKSCGAEEILAVVTHALGNKKIAGIDAFWTTNTVPQRGHRRDTLQVVSVAELLGQAIDSVASAKSISSLFKKKE